MFMLRVCCITATQGRVCSCAQLGYTGIKTTAVVRTMFINEPLQHSIECVVFVPRLNRCHAPHRVESMPIGVVHLLQACFPWQDLSEQALTVGHSRWCCIHTNEGGLVSSCRLILLLSEGYTFLIYGLVTTM